MKIDGKTKSTFAASLNASEIFRFLNMTMRFEKEKIQNFFTAEASIEGLVKNECLIRKSNSALNAPGLSI